MTPEFLGDLDILARTIYGEAEAGNETDACAIAAAIMNRVMMPNWPFSAREVCLQPWQFSCWNQNDPNRARILRADGPWFEICKVIAERALLAELKDETKRSTHYYADFIRPPKWAIGHEPVYDSGPHLFFNDIDTPPPDTAKDALDELRPLARTRTIQGGAAAAGATGLALIAELAQSLTPTLPLLQTLAQYAPGVLLALALAGIGWMLWARIDDREKGLR